MYEYVKKSAKRHGLHIVDVCSRADVKVQRFYLTRLTPTEMARVLTALEELLAEQREETKQPA